MNKIFLIMLLGITSLMIFSCKDQYDFSTDKLSDNIQVNPELALPLVDAQISIDKILHGNKKISYLQIDGNKFMSVIFNFDLAQIPATSFFGGVYSGPVVPITYNLARYTFDLGIDNTLIYDQFYIANPKATATLINYWNVPVQFKFTEFNYYPKQNSAGIPATGSFVTSWHPINKPTGTALWAATNYVMDTLNSNIAVMASALPHHFTIAAVLQTITVPASTFTVNQNTIDSVKLKMEIPLDFRIKNLYRSDTIEINVGKDLGSDTSKFESVKLNTIFNNGFPIDINAQLYFADSKYKIIDSLSSEKLNIASGAVSGGIVTSITKTPKTYTLAGTKKQNFLNSYYLIISYKFNTANNQTGQTVKIYSNYVVGFKAGALIKLKL